MILDLPFQRAGTEFLATRRFAYLADEMRLGKSRQAIKAADETHAEDILVIGPAIGRWNWVHEFEKHAFYPRKFDVVLTRDHAIKPYGSVSISYDLMRDPGVHAQLLRRQFDRIFIDEAHYVKGVNALQSHMLLGKKGTGLIHQSKGAWCLSGTPDPNGDPGEMWTILRTMFPEAAMGSYNEFMERYTVRWRLNRTSREIWKIRKVKNIDELKEKIAPFFLRRTKKQVRPELPQMRFGEIHLNVPDAPVLADIDWATAREGTLVTARRELGMAKARPVADFVNQELHDGLQKLVVFAWHIDVIEEIHRQIRAKKLKAVMLHGALTAHMKESALQQFQREDDCRVLVGQIKACGTNISLAAADDAIFAEQDWTPGNNYQAAMRIEDPAKTRPCMVRFAIARGTQDEILTRVLRRKDHWTQELLGD